jgi:hypothetical protein
MGILLQMNLTEQINNDVTDIKVKMKCDFPLCTNFTECMSSYKSGFLTLICGAPGSGKTSRLISLMMNEPDKKKKRTSFKNLFNSVTIFSPSLHTLEDNIFKNIPEENRYEEFNDENLNLYLANIQNEKELFNSIYNDPHNMKEEGRKDEYPFMNLLILDDVGNSIRGKKLLEEKFVTLIDNRRHHNTSIIVLLQACTQVPPKVRTSCNHFYSYKPMSVEEEEYVYKFVNKPKKYQKEFFDYIYRKPHDFMYIDKTQGKKNGYVFYRNFDKVGVD